MIIHNNDGKDLPEEGRRIITLSPVYPIGHEMRVRVIDSQFLRLCGEVTQWMYAEDCFEEKKLRIKEFDMVAKHIDTKSYNSAKLLLNIMKGDAIKDGY